MFNMLLYDLSTSAISVASYWCMASNLIELLPHTLYHKAWQAKRLCGIGSVDSAGKFTLLYRVI